MLFTDSIFLFFYLPFALLAHSFALSLGRKGVYHSVAKASIFFLTLVFYGLNESWWLYPFLLTTGFDLLWARLIASSENANWRKFYLSLSIVQNLSILFIFKYLLALFLHRGMVDVLSYSQVRYADGLATVEGEPKQ